MASIKANKLTEQQLAEITKKFKELDKDGNGSLDKSEMRELLEKTLNKKISDKMLDSYIDLQFNANDKNFNGVIELDEFIELYSKIYIDPELPIHMKAKPGSTSAQLESGNNAPKVKRDTLQEVKDRLTPQQIEEAKAKFAQYDKDSSGSIDKEELQAILLDTMKTKMSPVMIKRFVDMQFQLYDKNGEGTINMDEFLVLYENIYVNGNQGVPMGAPMGGMPMPGMGIPMPGMGRGRGKP